MRSGASVSQLLQESVLPRGARMLRVLSRRLGMVMALLVECPSPLAGEGGDPRSGEGEGFARSEKRRQPPHLPIAAQWVPSSPARGEEEIQISCTSRIPGSDLTAARMPGPIL